MAFPIELGLIILFSLLGGVLATRFRLPSVIGLIIIGALTGPNAFGIITDQSLVNASIEIGAVLLLFTVGIEFSLQKLLNLGLRAIIIAVMKLGAVFLLSYYSSFLLGFDHLTSAYIGVILSITSTVIVIKILDQKGLAKKEEMPLLITILILEDIFAVFALTFFSGINTKAELSPSGLFTDLLVSLTIMAISYVILQRLMKPAVRWLVKYSTEDTITFLSLGICALMSYIALLLGLSPSVGAFLAGNIVSSLPNSKIFEKAMHPFLLTFTSLFFFSIGTNVNLFSVFAGIRVIIVLFLVNVISKFFAIGFGSYIFTNFNGRQATLSGMAMVSIGEFSLLIAKEAQPLGIGVDLVSITASIILLSSIAMSFLLDYNEKIYSLTERLLPSRVKKDMSIFSKYLNSLSWTMIADKMRHKTISLEWRRILNNLLFIFLVFSASYFLWAYFRNAISDILENDLVLYALAISFFMAIFFPAFSIFRNLKDLLANSFRFFVKIYPKEIPNDKKLFRNILLMVLFFVAVIMLPGVFLFLRIKTMYHFFVFVLMLMLIFYIFRSSIIIIESLAKKRAKKLNELNKKYISSIKKKIKLAGREHEE